MLCFDETRNDLFTRYANIRILPWYNNTPPELTQLLFITGTENLCFIETNGRVRIYSLISGQFQPADGEFPRHSEIRCSPDGTCLIAFVRQSAEPYSGVTENIEESSRADDNTDIARKDFSENTEAIFFENQHPITVAKSLVENQFNISNELSVDVDLTKISAALTPKQTADSKLNVHVFLLNNLRVASKVVQIPTLGNPIAIQLSFLAGRQIHLLYIPSSYEYFASIILKITIERNVCIKLILIEGYKFAHFIQNSLINFVILLFKEWRFNRSHKAITYLGKIKIASALSLPGSAKLPQGCQVIEGSATQFSKIVEPEDFLVIRGEKRPIKGVLSDTYLIVEGTYPPSITEDYANEYLEFKVERKPNSNEYIDCYSNMYQKYPIESCIQDNGEVSIASANSLHVVLGITRQQYVNCDYSQKFLRYITNTFNNLENATNKPASLLQHFKTNAVLIEDLDVWQLCRTSEVRPIGKWLIQCSCLLPIQVYLR